MKPPPPMFPAVGWVTASANAVATAASTAVPPSASASRPIVAAIVLWQATIPSRARVGWEPAEAGTARRRHSSRTRAARFMGLLGSLGSGRLSRGGAGPRVPYWAPMAEEKKSGKVRWGVLGVAGIAVKKVIPAMQRG